MFSEALRKDCEALLSTCRKKGLTLATAESCTGGMISALITAIPGSSSVFERGFVTYSNASKTELLGVDADLISEHGAVSEPVAVAMASGGRIRAKVDICISVTGIAGPDGGTAEKPVGTVYIAVVAGHEVFAATCQFKGDREAVRLQSVEKALSMLREMLTHASSVSVA